MRKEQLDKANSIDAEISSLKSKLANLQRSENSKNVYVYGNSASQIKLSPDVAKNVLSIVRNWLEAEYAKAVREFEEL